jgi:hypothetical protein
VQTDETLAEVRVTVLFLWSWAGSELSRKLDYKFLQFRGFMMQRSLLVFTTFFLTASLAMAGEWVSLSSGDSLDGWNKLGGGATYVSKDGVITGTTGEGKNTFLTRGPYSDFDLEFDVRCDPKVELRCSDPKPSICRRDTTGIQARPNA